MDPSGKFSFKVLINTKSGSFNRNNETDTLVVTAEDRVLKVPITYDADIANEIIGDVAIIQEQNTAGIITAINGNKISFHESGILSATIYSINGTMLGKVISNRPVSSGETLSLSASMKNLVSGFYILKCSFNQKEFSVKIKK